jgi:hypothetical protein
VSFQKKEAVVTFDPAQVRVAQMIEAVRRAGFRASLKPPGPSHRRLGERGPEALACHRPGSGTPSLTQDRLLRVSNHSTARRDHFVDSSSRFLPFLATEAIRRARGRL